MSIRLDNAHKRALSTPFSVNKALELTRKKSYRRQMGRKKPIIVHGTELRNRRDALGLSQEEIGKRLVALLGYEVDGRVIGKIEREETKGGEIKNALVNFYGILPKGLPLTGHNAMTVTKPPSVNQGTNDPVPVYRTFGAEGGCMRVAGKPSGSIQRPDYLVDAKTSYAIVMRGDLMAPRFFAGDTLFVNPELPYQANSRGEYQYVFYNHDRSRTQVRTLVSFTAEEWHVCQLNPVMEYTLSRTEWPTAERCRGVGFQD